MPRTIDLDALFQSIRTAPDPDAAIDAALRGVDPVTARQELVARLAAPDISAQEAGTCAQVLIALDPEPVLDALFDLLVDDNRGDDLRLACHRCLLSVRPERIATAAKHDLRRAAATEYFGLYSAALAAHEQPEALDVVRQMVRGVPRVHRGNYARLLESLRAKVGLPASTLYAPLLADADIAADDDARKVLLDAIVSEPDAAGSALLQKLRAGASKKLRAPFQIALLKLETARIGGDGKGAADPIRAWSSVPDGQGAVVVLFAFTNPDGTCTLADLCFRLTRDLRQGFVVPRTQERELIETLQELGDNIELTSAPAGELATLVDEALASHRRMGVPTPAECEAPIRTISRVQRTPLPPPPTPAPVTSARVAEILGGRRHTTWFFDADDLARSARRAKPGNRDAVLGALARSPMRARVEAMARYMVHFARWSGNDALSATWSAMAEDVARSFEGSAVARAMYDASDAAPRGVDDAMSDYGTEGVLFPFSELFPDVAERETRVLSFRGHPSIPDGDYLMMESYCTDRNCRCERVTFNVVDLRRTRVLFRVGHAFTRASAKRFYAPEQTELDPTSAPPPWASAMVREIDARMQSEPEWRARVKRHYEMARSLR